MHAMTVIVAQHLDLVVAKQLDELLDVHATVLEQLLSTGPRRGVGVLQLLPPPHDGDTAPAAASDRLDDDRVAELFGDVVRVVERVDRVVGARHQRHAGFLHHAFGQGLVADTSHDIWLGADERDMGFGTDFSEIRILGEKTVARMDGIGVGHLGGLDDGRYIQIAAFGGGRSNADGLVGQLNHPRTRVGAEYTATVFTPNSRQAQERGTAISPRLAISTF